jgi:DNA-binding transcriptional LysR family regulator
VYETVSAMREAEAEASIYASNEPQGLLRLALPSTFGRMWIAPLLPDFMARHPKLRIQAEFPTALST